MSDATPSRIDWAAVASRYQDEMTKLMHHEQGGPRPYGDDFYAEALRRTFGYSTNAEEGRRQLPYDSIGSQFGLTTQAQADHYLSGCTVIDRLNRERAEDKVKELRAEVARVYRDARADLAESLREWCNERRIPARLRREGFLMAADQIDPGVARDQYGNVVKPSTDTAA